jgi:hypothetical protein
MRSEPLEEALLLELGERRLPFFHEVLPRLVFLARDRAIPTDVQHCCGHGSVLLVSATFVVRKGNAENDDALREQTGGHDVAVVRHRAVAAHRTAEMHAHVGVPPQPAGSVWHA